MPTDGIPDVISKLHEIGGYLDPQDISTLASRPEANGESFVGRYLRQTGVVPSIDQADMIEGLLRALHFGWVSQAGPHMKHGIWDHFKGGIYFSDSLGLNADTGELEVEYISCRHGTRHHRRCSQWNEVVRWPDGEYRSRFVCRDLDKPTPSFKVTPAESP